MTPPVKALGNEYENALNLIAQKIILCKTYHMIITKNTLFFWNIIPDVPLALRVHKTL